jgi:hypothetical protein
MSYPEAIPEELESHFIRGLLDSDGCWHRHLLRGGQLALRGSFCFSSKGFIDSLRSKLIKLADVSVTVHVSRDKRSDSYRISYATKDSIRLGTWLYWGSMPAIQGDRKFGIWNGFVKDYSTNLDGN